MWMLQGVDKWCTALSTGSDSAFGWILKSFSNNFTARFSLNKLQKMLKYVKKVDLDWEGK